MHFPHKSKSKTLFLFTFDLTATSLPNELVTNHQQTPREDEILTSSQKPAQVLTDFTRPRSSLPVHHRGPTSLQTSAFHSLPPPQKVFLPNGNAKANPRATVKPDSSGDPPAPRRTIPAADGGRYAPPPRPAKGPNAARSCGAGPEGQPALPHPPPAPRAFPLTPQLCAAMRRGRAGRQPQTHTPRGEANPPKMAAGEPRLPRRARAVRACGGRRRAAAAWRSPRRFLRPLRQVGRQRAACPPLPSPPS